MSDSFDTVREALPSMEGHEANCPCSVGRAHAALAEIKERLEELEKERNYWAGDGVALQQRAEKAEAELRLLANPDGVFRSGDLTATRIRMDALAALAEILTVSLEGIEENAAEIVRLLSRVAPMKEEA